MGNAGLLDSLLVDFESETICTSSIDVGVRREVNAKELLPTSVVKRVLAQQASDETQASTVAPSDVIARKWHDICDDEDANGVRSGQDDDEPMGFEALDCVSEAGAVDLAYKICGSELMRAEAAAKALLNIVAFLERK